jgi:hypothetical protein
MPNYTVYHGKFLCHECKAEVGSLRLYAETKEMTWMCKDKHLSKVNLGRRKKKDFDGEE